MNAVLDKFARTKIRVSRRQFPAFQVCGYTGLVAALILAMVLVRHARLSIWVMAGVAATVCLTFLTLAMAAKIISGREQLVYYRQEIVVMAAAALLLTGLGQPLLPYLDIAILGIGMFLAFGRIGCLMVGCCHGRAGAWGVRYRAEHAAEGFDPYLVGVRLFPIQAIEALAVLAVVVQGTTFILAGQAPGTALAWYTVAYGFARFVFEFARGDADRPYLFGFSEGQWVSLLLTSAIVWGEYAGQIPFRAWHAGATLAIVLTMVGVSLWRRFVARHRFQLLHPCHVSEVARALDVLSQHVDSARDAGYRKAGIVAIPVFSTSLGLQISGGQLETEDGWLGHYSFSSKHTRMDSKTASVVVRLIVRLQRGTASKRVIRADHGVFHLLLRPTA